MIKEAAIEQTKTFTPNSNDNDNILISWIIIGHKWNDAQILVDAINKQNMDSKLVELIIIDDCSEEKPAEILQKINYNNKQIITLIASSGRCKARNEGIKLAKGEFCLFTNNNTIPTSDFITQYINNIYQFNIDGAAGIINYTSKDLSFENYLNYSTRGLKKFCEHDLLSINHVLFGNCAIKTDLLKQVDGFNEKLMGYGGEELELLSRVEQIKKLIIIKVNATVIRINHPTFDEQCNRLIDFGKTNFKLLPTQIKIQIVPKLILSIYKLIPASILIWKLKIMNKLINGNVYIMKWIMGLSIIKGYKK